ncbi:MAG: hypothetical protein ACREXS_05745, partial [Gammaproteobacteria bacterium]
MRMGRRRTHRLDLPQRVYFDHGSYFFVPPTGPKVNLGRDYGKAMAHWAEIVDRPTRLVTLGEIMDRYMREVAPLKAVAVTVGMPLTRHPPCRSVRAELPHTAPALGEGGENARWAKGGTV